MLTISYRFLEAGKSPQAQSESSLSTRNRASARHHLLCRSFAFKHPVERSWTNLFSTNHCSLTSGYNDARLLRSAVFFPEYSAESHTAWSDKKDSSCSISCRRTTVVARVGEHGGGKHGQPRVLIGGRTIGQKNAFERSLPVSSGVVDGVYVRRGGGVGLP